MYSPMPPTAKPMNPRIEEGLKRRSSTRVELSYLCYAAVPPLRLDDFVCSLIGGHLMSGNGLATIASSFSVEETIDRLASKVTSLGLVVFARIDHAAGAAKVGMELRPTELLIFGNPKGGTPLMQDQQTAGIDLPVKALAWQDATGQVWLTTNDAAWIAERHQLGASSADAVKAMAAGLAALTPYADGQNERETYLDCS